MSREQIMRPLNGEEKLAFAYQEARGYPMEVYPAGRFDGPIDTAKLQQAFSDTLETFPHLRRLLIVKGTGRRKRLFWSRAGEDALKNIFEVRDLEADDDDFDKAFQSVQWKIMNSPGIDLTREVGMRCQIFRAGPERHYIIFRFNHILADGRGIIIFLALWRERYADLLAGKAGPIEPFPEPETGTISIWKMLRSGGFSGLWRLLRTLFASIRERRGKPAIHLARYDPGLAGEFRTCEVRMPADRLTKIRRKAKEAGLTINDISLAAAYHAILRWCRLFGMAAGRITINSPQDLRDVGSTEVANYVVPRTISLDPDRIQNDGELFGSIRSQLRQWSESRYYMLAALGMTIFSRLPYDFIVRAIRRTQERGANFSATLLLTNLGEITKYGDFTQWGNLRMNRLFHGARGQYPPGYIIPLFSLGGILTFAMGYYHPAMTEEKCIALGRLFMEEIERLVGIQPLPSPPAPGLEEPPDNRTMDVL